MQVYATSLTAVAKYRYVTLSILAWSTAGVASDNNMLVGPVTLNGPVPSTTPYTAAGATSPLTARTGMVALSTSNWDGIASTTTTPALSATTGLAGSYSNKTLIGPWTVILQPNSVTGTRNLLYIVQASKQTSNFPTSVPGGSYSFFVWFKVASSDPAVIGVSRNYGFLTVGNAYSVSLWYVKRADGSAGPPVFQVTLGGKTVWSTSPSSTSWVRFGNRW